MREEQIVGADGKTIRIRVVMSGDYTMPEEGFIRKQIAKNRIKEFIPDYETLNLHERKKQRHKFGITYCAHCGYPQPIENKICCFCEKNTKYEKL